ncbi:putative ABC exporter domain-containing protein [Coprothermobacter platensis]|uniref:putative ABC exporter domain-containing protein n=1 Tax=Coprothermobacter platensis TaxID=108819 RepID=UPI00036566B9|nr:putative ABC exporter domain-containing protein [Coprothermobacter platensis]
MRANKVINDFRTLLFLDATKYKNYVIDATKHPVKFLGLMIQYGLQFIWILPLLLMNPKNNNGAWYLSVDIVGAVVMAILLFLFLSGLNKASVNYAPGAYSMADVDFLFPSPLNQRVVYAWSMIREFASSVYATILVAIYLPFAARMLRLPIMYERLVYSVLTVMLVSVLVSAMNFFVFSVSHRFGIGKTIKTLIKLFTFVIVLYIFWHMFKAQSLWAGLILSVNSKLLASIPLIGWAKTLIVSPILYEVSPLPLFLLLLCSTCLVVGLSIYFAVDFYEESAELAQWSQAIRKGDIGSIPNENGKKKSKARELDLNWNLKGAWAFTWRQAIANKRSSRFIILGWDQLAPLLFGIIGGVFMSHDFESAAVIVLIYMFSYVSMMANLPVGLQYELHKQYIFLLPGKPRQKILAVNLLLSLKAVVRSIALTLPLWIISDLSFLQGLSIFLFVLSVDVLSLFGMTIVNVLSPSYDSKNVLTTYLRLLIFVISILPALLVAILLSILTRDFLFAYLGFAVGAVITLFLQLILADKIFWRMEMPK